MTTHTNRHIILLYIFCIFKYPIFKNDQEKSKFAELYVKDFDICPDCFQPQKDICSKIANEIEYSTDLADSLNGMFGVRQSRIGLYKKSKVVVKYTGNEERVEKVRQAKLGVEDEEGVIERLKGLYFDENRVEGVSFCPPGGIDKFIKTFENFSRLSVWTHLNTNFQPILLPILNQKGFPVPFVHATCGLTMYESHDGETLMSLQREAFQIKAQISIQLLEAALSFTEGFNGYRLYLTDANLDNIVYDRTRNRVSFVDLDNLIVVDSKSAPKSDHKHDMIECDGCFAYAPVDVCAAKRSDLNLFAICQLLREDMYKDRSKGFLYPVPKDIHEQYPELVEILDFCVDCRDGECTNRFDVVAELLETLRIILNEI